VYHIWQVCKNSLVAWWIQTFTVHTVGLADVFVWKLFDMQYCENLKSSGIFLQVVKSAWNVGKEFITKNGI